MIQPLTVDLYRLAAAALARPDPSRLTTVSRLAEARAEEAGRLSPLVARLGERAAAADREALEGEYHRLFSGQVPCSPYESEYGPHRTLQKARELADISGFYRVWGVEPDPPEMVDHVSLELDFLAWLGFKELHARDRGWAEPAEVAGQSYAGFLEAHPGRWLESFARRVEEVAGPDSFYTLAARLAAGVTRSEVERLGLQPEQVQRAGGDPEPPACGACPGPRPAADLAL